MDKWKPFSIDGRLGIAVSAIIALSFLVIILLGLKDVAVTEAAGTARYVDGASGNDIGNCNNPSTPCESIGYVLSRSVAGDTIRVAQGLYLENLVVDRQVTLEGGYQANSWLRDIDKYETVIDGFAGRYIVGDWDGRQVVKPTVIKDGDQYKMWFDGTSVLGETKIGYATSSVGVNWVKHPSSPVLADSDIAWKAIGQRAPFVLKDSSLYKMWFEYEDANVSARQLGYATSMDGINWMIDPDSPVLEAGPEDFDDYGAAHGSIIKEDGTYKLWYLAIEKEGASFAYATSLDGLNWIKQGSVVNPADIGWDNDAIWGPSVLKFNSIYWLWYSGSDGETASIGVITSTNGINWNRFLSSPVITDTEANLGDPQVILDGDTFKMWYNAWYDDPVAGTWRGQINYAESDDGIHWIKYSSNPILIPGQLGKEGRSTIYFVDQSDGSKLDGFTIRGGHSPYGGGISIHAKDITIRQNTIMENTAQGGDGGIQAYGGSSVSIMDNKILNNHTPGGAGGGITIHGSEASISGNYFEGNSSYYGGGGIWVYDSEGSITDNELVGNTTHTGGGGILVNETEHLITITQNEIRSNVANWGGGIQVHEAGILIDSNFIQGNRAGYRDYSAGGISIVDPENYQVAVFNNVIVDNENEGLEICNFSEAQITNNTIVNNERIGVELCAWPDVPPDPFSGRIHNNIIVGHTSCGVNGFNGVTIIARNNDVWNNTTSFCGPYVDWNNISEDPLFVNPGSNDYHLQVGSPAIDTGANVGAPAYDKDGNPRPYGNGFDIGAYEWPPYWLNLPLIMKAQ